MCGRARLSSDVSEIKLVFSILAQRSRTTMRALSSRLLGYASLSGGAALFLLLALGGCAQAATGPGQAPYAPYSREDGSDIRSGPDGGGGGGGGGM
jgi:hypothetical protein